jgi:hypothetical protein
MGQAYATYYLFWHSTGCTTKFSTWKLKFPHAIFGYVRPGEGVWEGVVTRENLNSSNKHSTHHAEWVARAEDRRAPLKWVWYFDPEMFMQLSIFMIQTGSIKKIQTCHSLELTSLSPILFFSSWLFPHFFTFYKSKIWRITYTTYKYSTSTNKYLNLDWKLGLFFFFKDGDLHSKFCYLKECPVQLWNAKFII